MPEPATSRPPLALVVNDKEWSARSVESILSPNGYAVLRASNGAEALKHARGASPDIIIMDLGLPDRSGMEVCRTLRADPRVGSLTPIILTTARAPTRRQRIDSLQAGAWDFFPLPLDSEALLLKLRVYMQAKFEADRLQRQTLIDVVTGLYNLDGLLRRLREIGSEAYRHERALACVAFAPDLDGAEGEGVSDRNGAVVEALDRMSRIFHQFCRTSDAVGQVRSAEFIVIAPSTDAAGAERLARRLARATEAEENAGEKKRIRLLAGFYAASNFRDAEIQPEEVLARATEALRRSQSDPGRGRIQPYNGGP